MCFTKKDLGILIFLKFMSSILNKTHNNINNNNEINTYIKKLADDSIDSQDYEYWEAISDLSKQFTDDCELCFVLKDKVNLKIDVIKTLDDLTRLRDESPDVVIKNKDGLFEFELKRYRGDLTTDSLYSFIEQKIIKHYSGLTNYLILLQPKPNSTVSNSMFVDIHTRLKDWKNFSGIIGLSFNHNNKEMILVQVMPKLLKSKYDINDETQMWVEIFYDEEKQKI